MVKKKPPHLSDDDLADWKHISETVKPLPAARKNIVLKEPKAARVKPAIAVSVPAALGKPKQALDLSNDTAIARGDRKRIKQGVLRPDVSIDLHGMTVAKGEKTLFSFVQRAVRDGHEWVEIITGHGRFKNSDEREPGVLKRLLPEWLNSTALRPLIKRVIPAPNSRGGAVWVRVINE